jgi:hypothetical protein
MSVASEAGTGTTVLASYANQGGIIKSKITIPATKTASTITILPTPGYTTVGVKPDMGGTGTDTWTVYQSQDDADEVAETVTLTDSVTSTFEGPGRIICTYATGNAESFIWIVEYVAQRVLRN